MVAKRVNIQVHISNRCIWATHVLLRLSLIHIYMCIIDRYLDEVTGYWLKGDQERSRYYNHSTFNDLMITGLRCV